MIKANFELWKDVEGFEGLYQVSTWGNVKSIKNNIILKPTKNNKGYFYVDLHKNRKRKRFLINRLVAEAFIPNPDNLLIVNHKDEVKTNNYRYNLEWCTYKYNNEYGTARKRMIETKIKQGIGSKTVYQYDMNGNIIKVWRSASDIQRELGYNSRTISSCCNKTQYSHKGFVWSFNKIDEFNPNDYINPFGPKIVYQYDLNYNLIKKWDSITIAAKQNKTSTSSISGCCKGKYKTCKGYIWSYTEINQELQ